MFETTQSNVQPQAAAVAEAEPQRTLADDFRQQYLKVCDCDLQALCLERRRTTEYLALGRLAHSLQEELGYGNWGEYLQTHGYVERTISRALRIYRNLKDHPDFADGLTLAEAEQYGEQLAKSADDEAKQIAESVERSKKSATTRVGRKADNARAELRKKVIEALTSTDGLEKELRAILEPDQAEDAPQLLLESDASSKVTLKEIFASTHSEGLPPVDEEGEKWQHGNEPCENCQYLWEVMYDVVTGDDIGVTDDERAAFDEFVGKYVDEGRALRVMLLLAHDKLCQ